VTGRRLPNGFECTTPELQALGFDSVPRGAYWIDSGGAWAVCTPNGRIGSIAKHTVVEHEDGTITVSPSILIYPHEPAEFLPEGRPGWHGFLERGVWREC
jgi:hypothetical protein